MTLRKVQAGFFLIEALVAILIFSLGILGVVGMGAAAMSAQSDAQFRTEAANLANEIASQIALNVDRSSAAATAASLAVFVHRPNGDPCEFDGDDSVDPRVIAWIDKVKAANSGLPGSTEPKWQQIAIDTSATAYNRVQVSVCWQAPSDAWHRRHTLITYVN